MVQGIQTLERACDLLRHIAARGSAGETLTTLSHAIGLTTPTCHRMLKGLAGLGLAHYDETARRYRIGPLAFELGLVAVSPLADLAAYRADIADVAEQTGDTAYLMMLRSDEIVCLINQEGSHQIRTNIIEVGARRPMCDSVAGLALLAAMEPAETERSLERALRLPAISTRLSRPEMMQKIAATRARGVAYWSGVVIPDIAGAAIAVKTPGYSSLAVALSTVASRLDEARLAAITPILQAAARAIEQQWARATLPAVGVSS